jgi:hypothetical protein
LIMPQIYRRRPQDLRSKPKIGSYYRPVKRQSAFSVILRRMGRLPHEISKLPRRFLIIVGSAALVIALVITTICILSSGSPTSTAINNNNGKTAKPGSTPTATDATVSLPPRQAALAAPLVTPEPVAVRDISFGAKSIHFTEKQINQPNVYGDEIFFSGGTGSLDSGAVLKKLYLYNIKTDKETKIKTISLAYGEFYETLINKNWLVWLETDHHTFNYIYVQNRKTGDVTKIKNCKNGKPKLRLAGDTLIWMEEVDKNQDQLMMFDLVTQDNMSLFTFDDVATYGVSAPCIYEESSTANPTATGATASPTASPSPTATASPTPTATAGSSASPTSTASSNTWDKANSPDSSDLTTIVWAGPDASQSADKIKSDGEQSTIYWVPLGQDAIDENGNIKKSSFSPKTYVHEPLYNGTYFAWIDGNYSPNSKLYLSLPNGTPQVIAQGVTTYSLGDGILVYGKNQQVWVYVISTGETCRLTSGHEKGMLPYVTGRTVLWYDLTDGDSADTLRYKKLSDQDLLLGNH